MLALLLLALLQAQAPDDPYPVRLDLPAGSGTIVFKAPLGIRKAALGTARRKAALMLQHADPDVVERLGAAGLEVAVAPERSRFTDLPDLRPVRGQANLHGQQLDLVRAVYLPIAVPGRLAPLVAVGEEDILRLPPLHQPHSQLHHELAHAVYFDGLTRAQRDAWIDLFRAHRLQGLFGRQYATLNPEEFFARLSEAYFDTAPFFCSREQLQRVSPAAFAFLDRVYDPARSGPPLPWSRFTDPPR